MNLDIQLKRFPSKVHPSFFMLLMVKYKTKKREEQLDKYAFLHLQHRCLPLLRKSFINILTCSNYSFHRPQNTLVDPIFPLQHLPNSLASPYSQISQKFLLMLRLSFHFTFSPQHTPLFSAPFTASKLLLLRISATFVLQAVPFI